ncbi:MAG: YeeE/YedE family protein [Gammaproteobacteria bacterium]|nr:YeeE/YedE family protein [Gammaproteobacteria bacterium]MCK5262600.1 YeeE/YedE family protein [Gammaproteobacteria bacterium]
MSFESFAEALSFFFWGAFITAIILGVVVNKTNFCTMGAVSDMVNMQDYGRFRAWLLAIAVATLGVTLLEYLSMMNVSSTFPPYRGSQLIIAENLVGGLLFGIGMTLGSGCGNKTLIRIGGGNIKSVVVFAVIAVIAYYMLSPLPGTDQTLFSLIFFDWIRPLSINLESQQDIGAMIAGDDSATARLISGLIVSVALLVFIFKSADFRSNKDNLLAGLVVGSVILGGWYLSSNIVIDNEEEFDEIYTLSDYYQNWEMIAEDDEGKPAQGRTLSSQSYTFINPIGQTYGYIKGSFDSALLTFGLLSVFGVILGSFIWSLLSRSFRIEWFHDKKDFATHMIGAVLMGFGGVLALGCTIGQGITGVSTLALGSFLTLIAIIFGSALTMKIQYYRMLHEDASFVAALSTSLVDMKLLPSSMRKLENL